MSESNCYRTQTYLDPEGHQAAQLQLSFAVLAELTESQVKPDDLYKWKQRHRYSYGVDAHALIRHLTNPKQYLQLDQSIYFDRDRIKLSSYGFMNYSELSNPIQSTDIVRKVYVTFLEDGYYRARIYLMEPQPREITGRNYRVAPSVIWKPERLKEHFQASQNKRGSWNRELG
jgi:hypothetical protein